MALRLQLSGPRRACGRAPPRAAAGRQRRPPPSGLLQRTLERPLDSRSSHQSILEEISPGCSLEGLMLKLQLPYFGHLMGRADSLEKTPTLGKTEGRRRRGRQRMRWLDITDSVDMGLSKLSESEGQGSPACCRAWGHRVLELNYHI